MYQLVIIGGGASGLAAAVTAAACGLERIAVLEQMPRTGKKILATGNGRCNLSHTGISSADYRGSVPTERILQEFGNADDFFRNLGLFCRTDAAGRMYPYNMSASAVLDALRQACIRNGTEEYCGQCAAALHPQKNGWEICTQTDTFHGKAVLFAAGGYAAPKLGTDGSAWKLLENLGIPLIPPRPVLCPILTDPVQVRSLKGLRVRAQASLYDHSSRIAGESGEVQFTQTALSGICIFNLAEYVHPEKMQRLSVHLDLFPEWTKKETAAILYELISIRHTSDGTGWLSGIVQKPLAQAILKQAGIAAGTICTELNGKQIFAVGNAMHDLVFPVTGLGTWEQAQATAGGISGRELDENLQIKMYPGLYAAGEALDVHSICGGYHLHWAWSSGAYAARRIAERIL